jgi:hypothetical protein
MSEEEEENIETTIEEQLTPEKVKPTTLNKNGKPRKQLSPEHLEKLQHARAKANAIRKQNSIKKLEDKIENINKQTEPILGSKPNKEIKKEPQEKELEEEHEEVEIVKEKPKSKPKGKKKTKIIVEQSSDDSDDFEPNDNVVFVKRVSRKKKEVPIVPEPKVEMELPPPEPPKPPRPELTPQQRLLKSQYEGMFGGGFMNNNLMRRHY